MTLYDPTTCRPLFSEAEARSLEHYDALPQSAQDALQFWIRIACKPCQQKPENSYAMKQPLTRELFYFTTGQLAGAFRAAGYRVECPRGANWLIYCRPRPERHGGRYLLDHASPDDRAELERLCSAAREAIWGPRLRKAY